MSNIPLKSITFPGLGNKYTVNANPLALSTKDRTAIPEDSDMDNYTTIGNYKVTTTAIARTIANIPSQTAGSLFVMSGSESVRLYQIYFAQPTAGIRIFAREKLSTSAWTDWIELTYRYTFDNAPTADSANPVTSDGIFDALAEKADAEGKSPNLVAGSAEAILSDSYTEDSVPYRFRQTPVNSKRMDEKIIGGTVAWHQLMYPFDSDHYSNASTSSSSVTFSDNGFTTTATEETSTCVVALGSAYRTTFPANHVLLTMFDAKQNRDLANIYSASPDSITISGAKRYIADVFANAPINEWFSRAYMIRRDEEITNFGIRFAAASTAPLAQGDEASIRNLQSFDLTAMFGTAIADYIYGLETATAGAGVAFFRSLFGASYYPYNAGELISISGLSARKAVGKNLLDPSLTYVNGKYINSDGTIGTLSAYQYCESYIPVFPDTAYVFSGDIAINSVYNAVAFYDSNKTFIGRFLPSTTNRPAQFTTPSNCAYIRFNASSASWVDFATAKIQLEFGTTATAYEPYDAHTYPLDSTLTIRGIPKLDSANRLYFDGDRYASDGTVTRRYGLVDLGTLNWAIYNTDTTGNSFFVNVPADAKPIATNDRVLNAFCGKYEPVHFHNLDAWDNKDKVICQVTSAQRWIIRDTAYTDAATFKTAMSGVYLVYELATATTETAEPYQETQICSPDGTEEYVSTGIVPIGHETKYYKDIVSAIEGIPDAPTANGTYVLKCTVSGGVATYSWATQ